MFAPKKPGPAQQLINAEIASAWNSGSISMLVKNIKCDMVRASGDGLPPIPSDILILKKSVTIKNMRAGFGGEIAAAANLIDDDTACYYCGKAVHRGIPSSQCWMCHNFFHTHCMPELDMGSPDVRAVTDGRGDLTHGAIASYSFHRCAYAVHFSFPPFLLLPSQAQSRSPEPQT